MVLLELLHTQGSQEFLASPGSTLSSILNLHKTLFQQDLKQEYEAYYVLTFGSL